MKKRGKYKRKKEKRQGGYSRKEEILKFIIIVAIFLAILLAIYYFFLYTKICQTQECFSDSLVRCKRAEWRNDVEEATWLYVIKGQSGKNCEVEVKLLLAKKGKLEIGKIEGKNMACYLPLNTVTIPEQNLANCKGELKEELQDLIIKRMHSYILENLGEISEEVIKPI